jgi:hypothetical protein
MGLYYNSNVLIGIGNALRDKEPREENILALSAVFVALINGRLICDYALWETVSVLGKGNFPQNAFDNVMLLSAIRNNPRCTEELLSRYFSGKSIQGLREYLIAESKKHESDIIDWLNSNISWVLPGELRLFGDDRIALMMLYADALQQIYLSEEKDGKSMFLSFIEYCEKNRIPFNSRAIFTGAAVCNGYYSSIIKKKGFKVDSDDKIMPKHISIQDVVNMAFDLAICDKHDEVKKEGKLAAVLSFDKGLRKHLSIGYKNCITGILSSDFNYLKIFDTQINDRVREFKNNTDELNIQNEEIWDTVGRISGNYFWSDAKKFAWTLS